MGVLRSRFGIGKSTMGFGLGLFHLFLSVTFLTTAGGDTDRFWTGLLLIGVGTGMILWGLYHHRYGTEGPAESTTS